jgi:galactose mutarotase-like enzyme
MIEIFSQDNINFASVSITGAEIVELSKSSPETVKKSIFWDVNEAFWNRVSPILFPLVGKVKNNRYHVLGSEYELPQHGFARNSEFQLLESTSNFCKLILSHSTETLKVYPFEFQLIVEYTMLENGIQIKNTVVNPSSQQDLFYSIGAHPGFQLHAPLEEYSIELFDLNGQPFAGDFVLQRHLIHQGLYTGETELVEFKNGRLDLDYNLFQSDAIVFKHEEIGGISVFRGMELLVNLTCKTAPFWGIWTKPGAPFLCLEPWNGIADHVNHNGNFLEKEGVLKVRPQMSEVFEYQIFL